MSRVLCTVATPYLCRDDHCINGHMAPRLDPRSSCAWRFFFYPCTHYSLTFATAVASLPKPPCELMGISMCFTDYFGTCMNCTRRMYVSRRVGVWGVWVYGCMDVWRRMPLRTGKLPLPCRESQSGPPNPDGTALQVPSTDQGDTRAVIGVGWSALAQAA